MSHVRDPEGIMIELLQREFKGNERPFDAGHPIAMQARLAHITLRTTDLVAAKEFCENQLGSRILSIQLVLSRGFTLYFYAWNDEPPPHPNLKTVIDRVWLWSRPYTLLELQHLINRDSPVGKPSPDEVGFSGFGYQSKTCPEVVYLSLAETTSFQ